MTISEFVSADSKARSILRDACMTYASALAWRKRDEAWAYTLLGAYRDDMRRLQRHVLSNLRRTEEEVHSALLTCVDEELASIGTIEFA